MHPEPFPTLRDTYRAHRDAGMTRRAALWQLIRYGTTV